MVWRFAIYLRWPGSAPSNRLKFSYLDATSGPSFGLHINSESNIDGAEMFTATAGGREEVRVVLVDVIMTPTWRNKLPGWLFCGVFLILLTACNDPLDEQLRRAAIKGDVEQVKVLLAKGSNLRYRHGGWTVLMFAVKEGHTDVVRTLLGSGADPNDKSESKEGAAPLTIAAEHGHFEITQLLLNNGADVNGRNDHGNTALMYAAEYNHPDIAQVLLNAKADTALKDNDGETALMIAQRKNHTEIINLLTRSSKD